MLFSQRSRVSQAFESLGFIANAFCNVPSHFSKGKPPWLREYEVINTQQLASIAESVFLQLCARAPPFAVGAEIKTLRATDNEI